MIRGTQGYEAQASELAARYEAIGFIARQAVNRDAGVTWSRLVFIGAGEPA